MGKKKDRIKEIAITVLGKALLRRIFGNSKSCLKCGFCCYLVLRNEFGEPYPTDTPCPYLKNKLCRVYKNRLKSKVGEGVQCSPREESHFDYEGCPYNTGKPLVINHKLKE